MWKQNFTVTESGAPNTLVDFYTDADTWVQRKSSSQSSGLSRGIDAMGLGANLDGTTRLRAEKRLAACRSMIASPLSGANPPTAWAEEVERLLGRRCHVRERNFGEEALLPERELRRLPLHAVGESLAPRHRTDGA